MKRLFFFCVAVAALSAVIMFAFMKISPRELTATRMWVIKRRILQYAHSYNQMPYSLSDLLTIEGYDNSIEDGWGRVITSKVSPLGTVTLISLGRDGRLAALEITPI
jgi:uncharacterized membrane protein YpjA